MGWTRGSCGLVCLNHQPCIRAAEDNLPPRSPEDLQLQRLMQRDGSSKDDALSRVKSQMPISSKISYADAVIDNAGTLSELEAQVRTFIHRLDGAAGWSWRVSWLVPPFGLLYAVTSVLWRRFMRKRKQD